jgi:hypothetical protein
VKLRRLLFAALLAVCFDVAVPLEQSAYGGLVWEDDEEEAVRADGRREARGIATRASSPRREAIAARARLNARHRRPRPERRGHRVRVVHLVAPPPPAPTEDH